MHRVTKRKIKLLYSILKIYVRLTMPLFCNSIAVNRKDIPKINGPLLIASNHPNSFLDAIIFDILFDMPVTALARGDAFKNKKAFRLLRSLKMLPVYRMREGAENLNTNYDTFDTCIEIFKQGEGVLIFSEGFCVNEWHLRPLKKGTARLAFKAWDEGVPLKVLPAGINYSSFRKPGKKIVVNFGDFLEASSFEETSTYGAKYLLFNKELYARLCPLVYEMSAGNKTELTQKFGTTPLRHKLLLAPFAVLGALLHAPFYALAWIIAHYFNKKNVHFDSMLFAVLMLGYPLYLVLAAWSVSFYAGFPMTVLPLLLLPLTAFCYAKYEVRKG